MNNTLNDMGVSTPHATAISSSETQQRYAEVFSWVIALLLNINAYSTYFGGGTNSVVTIMNTVLALSFLLLQKSTSDRFEYERLLIPVFNFTYLVSTILTLHSTRGLSNIMILVMMNMLLFNRSNAKIILERLIALSEIALIIASAWTVYVNAYVLGANPFEANGIYEPFAAERALAGYMLFHLFVYQFVKRPAIVKLSVSLLTMYIIFQTGIRTVMASALIVFVAYYLIQFNLFRIRYVVACAVIGFAVLELWFPQFAIFQTVDTFNVNTVKKRSLAEADRPYIWGNYLTYMSENELESLVGFGEEHEWQAEPRFQISGSFIGTGYGPHNGFIAYFYVFGLINGILFFAIVIGRMLKTRSKYALSFMVAVFIMNVAQETFNTFEGMPDMTIYIVLGLAGEMAISSKFRKPKNDVVQKELAAQ